MTRYSIRSVELIHMNRGIMRAVKDTLSVYRAAIQMIGEAAVMEWGQLAELSSMDQLRHIESLIHTTKKHQAKYPAFDKEFHDFPSYYRRSAINFVIGQVSSYMTRKTEYEEKRYSAISNGKKFREKEPVLNLNTNSCPSMYYKEMVTIDLKSVRLKLFIRNTWDWVEVSIPGRDMKSLLQAMSSGGKLSSPTLIMKFHKVYLRFPACFPQAGFSITPLMNRKVLGVDLGINHGAVCSVVSFDGTIHGRFFDPFLRERGYLDHMLNRLRRVQRETGNEQSLSAFYTKLDGMKDNYAKQLARWIVNTAIQGEIYGIVMENLGRMKGRGKKKDRIHHWCKKRILSLVRGMALREGIRVFLVNPKNTSALAYDGSGPVIRDASNFSFCTFASGKHYHCDLNASYNIAARYFIREYKKFMSEKAWSECVAKVPALSKRTGCTLSCLWNIQGCLDKKQAA